MTDWLVRQGSGKPIGPVSTELVIRGVQAGKVALSAEVCRAGTNEWLPIDLVDEFAEVAHTTDDDAATRVTDSPWFLDQPSEPKVPLPKPALRPAPVRPNPSALGLPAAPRPPASAPRVGPPPARSAPAKPAEQVYDADDDAETRVAHPPSEAGQGTYEFDDETMTRVAAQRAPQQPIDVAPKRPGLLKTAPMWNADLAALVPPRKITEPGRPAPPTPRPAAGSRPESSIQVHPELVAPEMPPAPPGFARPAPAFPAPRPAPTVASFGPTLPANAPGPPAQAKPPAAYAPPQQAFRQVPAYGQQPPAYGQPLPGQQPMYGQQRGYGPPPQPYGPPPGYPPMRTGAPEQQGDGGVKALIALIVVLFMALMVILILLVLRR